MAGLYVHIPFCVQKCRYCDFPSFDGQLHMLDAYLTALHSEIYQIAPLCQEPFQTVFIGGGTPSLLSGFQMQTLFLHLRAALPLAPDAEISIECNPGTVDAKKLAAFLDAGCNRLSFGLQSTHDSLLIRIGRIHTAQAFYETYAAARQAGFSNINIDVMVGLPGQTAELYLHTLQDIISLSPQHISAYALILEEGTKLASDVQKKAETLPDEDAVCDMQDAGKLFLHRHGYSQYEISNFAKEGFSCKHNINYWQNGSYIGIGSSAHSAWLLPATSWTRWENAATITAYIQTAGLPFAQRVLSPIPPREEAFESIMLGLRLVRGISLRAFRERFHQELVSLFPKACAANIAKGWLHIDAGYAALTPRGLDMQNTVLQDFLEEC